MRGGQLDRRITVERPPVFVDPLYGPQPAPPDAPWDLVAARVPAQVMDALPSKSETVKGAMEVADRPARVRIRYMRGLRADMRITLHGEVDVVFQIVGGPAEIGRRQWTEFTVEAYQG